MSMIKRSIKQIISSVLAIKPIVRTMMSGHRFHPRRKVINRGVIVIGNGPSAKDFNFKKYKGKVDYCCVNYFANKNTELFFELKPRFYCMIESTEFLDGADVQSPDTLELISVLRCVNWKMVFITKQSYRWSIENDYIRWSYVSKAAYGLYGFKGNKNIEYWLYKHNLACGFYGGVVICAAYFFITQKYKDVYMVGTDESLAFGIKVNENNRVLWKNEHFYGSVEEDLIDKGEIEFGEGYRYIEMLASRLKQYYDLNEYANYCNVNLYNLCLNSYIDSIPKIELDALSECIMRRK